eukprot:TRINITY_DN7632_c0_g1_i3.p1 TRINITY_DN7632_c0_g1~~TRINITY_DN7632_c0_g1_i3.p1  ORF type:complete len:217 (-),score=51.48 TRINITY_DN7632_c0_g1_i3:146-796(-)
MEKSNQEEKEEEITLEEYFVYSARCGDMEGIELCLSEKIDVNTQDQYKNSPLHMACANGFEEIVRILLKAGAKIDILNESKNTPLHWAAYNGHTGIVKLLLENGANPNFKNEFDRTPLDEAIMNEREDIVDMLIPRTEISDPALEAQVKELEKGIKEELYEDEELKEGEEVKAAANNEEEKYKGIIERDAINQEPKESSGNPETSTKPAKEPSTND